MSGNVTLAHRVADIGFRRGTGFLDHTVHVHQFRRIVEHQRSFGDGRMLQCPAGEHQSIEYLVDNRLRNRVPPIGFHDGGHSPGFAGDQVDGLDDERLVFKMRVHDDDLGEAIGDEFAQHVVHLVDHCHAVHVDSAREQRPATGERLGLVSVAQGGQHGAVDAFRQIFGDPRGEYRVGADGQMLAVLFGRTDRHDDGTSLRLLEFRPGHVVHTAVATHCSTPLGWWWIGWSMNTPGSLGEGAGAEEIRCDSGPCRCFRGRGSSRPRRWLQRPPCTRPGRWTNRSGQSGQWR